jgi:hypothetical protein
VLLFTPHTKSGGGYRKGKPEEMVDKLAPPPLPSKKNNLSPVKDTVLM